MTRSAGKQYWSETVKVGSHRVYAWERLDRGGSIFIKFTDPAKRGRDRRRKMKLPGDFLVRDPRGRLLKSQIRRVIHEVHQIAARLLLNDRPVRTASGAQEMTVTEAFDITLNSRTGKYATKTRRKDEVARARIRLEQLLGATTPLSSVKHADIRGIWRELANRYRQGGEGARACGARQTEVTIDALYSVVSWLREEGALPSDMLLPMKRWRAALMDEWKQIVGCEVVPQRPRHSAEEMRRLFASLDNSRVDRRLALAIEIGGEQRLGQVLRCTRSQLALTLVEDSRMDYVDPPGLGIVRISGCGRKRASPVALTADQRRAVDAALRGYLSEYEAAYANGVIADYPLFPAGKMRRGTARRVPEPKALTRDAALGMFRTLEAVAGIASVKGRGWYGIRRIAADIAEDVEHDERVLNSITGHRDSTTRQLVYQNNERPEVLGRAAKTRAQLRGRTSPSRAVEAARGSLVA